MASLKQKTKKMEKLMSINVGSANLQEKLNMKIVIVIGTIFLLTACSNLDFEGYDPSTSLIKWVITKKDKEEVRLPPEHGAENAAH